MFRIKNEIINVEKLAENFQKESQKNKSLGVARTFNNSPIRKKINRNPFMGSTNN